MPPICSAQVAMMRSSMVGSVMSPARYSPPKRLAAMESVRSSRATNSTCAPSSQRRRAVASPMPLLAPVTTQTLSRRRRSISAAHGTGGAGSAHAAQRRTLGGGAVGAAEQRGVDEQREELPQRDPLLVAVGERRDLFV